jgi:uncharacterized FlgJ-related protein
MAARFLTLTLLSVVIGAIVILVDFVGFVDFIGFEKSVNSKSEFESKSKSKSKSDTSSTPTTSSPVPTVASIVPAAPTSAAAAASAPPSIPVVAQISHTAPKPKRYANIRDEIFKCDQVNESSNAEKLRILRKTPLKNVPSLALKNLPLLNASIKADRTFFIKSIISTMNKVNQIVMEHRQLLLSVEGKKKKSIKLTEFESSQFKKICKFYQTENFRELSLRVMPIPTSLAVAQAILESRFGSDKTIQKLNAYFGLAVSSVRLLKFDSLFNSAIAYMKTLNVHPQYKEFRNQRAIMMAKTTKVDGLKLASFVDNYGTNKNYRKLIQSIIKLQNLN